MIAWRSSTWTSSLEKVVLETTSRSLPEKLSNVKSGNLNSWKNLWTPYRELLLVEVIELDWVETMYEVLGPEGPYQSICSGSTDWVADLTERSWTTPDLVGNKLEFEGIGFESKDNVGFEPEYGACPIEEKDALLGLLSALADEWADLVWIADMGEEMNSSGPGRYGDSKSRTGVDDLFLLCLEGCLKTDFLFSAIVSWK